MSLVSGRLPVLVNGRVQPFDSVARNALLSMSGRSVVRVQDGPALSPSEWLLEAMTKPDNLPTKGKIFRIQHPDLEGSLGGQKEGLQYYSYNDLSGQLDSIQTQVQKLEESEADKGDDAEKLRTPYQRDLMHLYNSVALYNRLKANLAPASGADFGKNLALFQAAIIQTQNDPAKADSATAQAANEFLRVSARAAEFAYVRAIPPQTGQPRNAWTTVGGTFTNSPEVPPPVAYYAQMSAAGLSGDVGAFNHAVAGYRGWLQANNLTPELKKGGEEYLFNQTEPFYKSMVIYVAAALLGCIFWINLSEPLRRAGVALLLLAFAIHTFGLVYRMWLEGRPPVTNLYSSAIFVGWAAVLTGSILERIFKGGIGLVASGLIGFTTLIIAHHLALSGDTMEIRPRGP